MNKTFKRAGIVAGGVGAIASISLASFAFFTTTASVTAEGRTDTAQPVQTVRAAITPALYPGDCSDVTFTLSNPSSHAVNGIRSITKIDFGSADATLNANLRLPYIATEGPTSNAVLIANGYDFQPIAAGGGQDIVLPNAICLAPGAPDSVQGKDITVNLTLAFKQAVGTEYTGS
jgi:hypothetical protein